MNEISDFNDADRWVVETTLRERYGKRITVEIADSEKNRAGVTSGKTGADLNRG
ncbi:MAG: hypothetical protein AABZ67_04440 [Pseudomonadota bacterium]